MGRDLVTYLDGDTAVVDAGAFEATVDYANAQRVVALASTPAVAGLDQLVGRSASTGFRAALNEVVAGQDLVGRPVYQLLDDLPVATLISGYSPQQAMAARGSGRDAPRARCRGARRKGSSCVQQADLCAGWKAGGTIMLGHGRRRTAGGDGTRRAALDRADDPWAWHEVPGALPALVMRRRRRIDVVPAPDDATVLVDAHFRDSHVDDEGTETVVHEYVIGLVLDGRDLRVVDSSATPRVLPWFECPEAAGSAERLVGRPLDGLRASVRAEFLGTSTCTHLNDALRALEDVPALVRHL